MTTRPSAPLKKLEKDVVRVRTAPELARMFWTESKYGCPMVDGLALVLEERQLIAQALVNYHAQRKPSGK